ADVASGSTSNAVFARFAPLLCAAWKPDPYRRMKVTIGDPNRILTDHGDPKLLADCLKELQPAHFDKGEQNEAIAKAIVALKPTAAGRVLTEIFANHTHNMSAACIDLWNRVAALTEEDVAPAWLRQSLKVLVEHLAKAKAHEQPA